MINTKFEHQNELVALETIQQIKEISQSAKEIFENVFAANTKRAYQSDWKDYLKWLSERGQEPHQADVNTILDYMVEQKEKGLKYSTIQRRLVSLRFFYQQFAEHLANKGIGYNNPATSEQVKVFMKGLRKTIGTAPKQKRAANKRLMQSILNELSGDRLADIRNRALLALGYAGAFRRSELSKLNIEDIERDNDGIYVTVRKSKTDQDGKGLRKFIYYANDSKYCPVRLLENWIRSAGITEGALFRQIKKGGKIGGRLSDTSIYNIVRDSAEKAGFDKAEFGGHSLRRGLITQLADDGAEERDIMRHTGHKSNVIMRRYIEEVDVKKKSPTRGIL